MGERGIDTRIVGFPGNNILEPWEGQASYLDQMRFNIASAQDKLGLAVLAVREYQAYLKQTAAVPAAVRKHITQRMAALTRKVGQIRLSVTIHLGP